MREANFIVCVATPAGLNLELANRSSAEVWSEVGANRFAGEPSVAVSACVVCVLGFL